MAALTCPAKTLFEPDCLPVLPVSTAWTAISASRPWMFFTVVALAMSREPFKFACDAK